MMKFTIPFSRRVFLFLCISALCLIVGSILAGLLLYGGMTTPRVRIATVVQDLLVFITPAIITAVIICRRPGEFLMIEKGGGLLSYLLVALTILAAVPAMNSLVAWNAGISLPEGFAPVEAWMKSSEENATQMVRMLVGGNSAGSLVMTLLIAGVLAGFSEELFFRGTIQRLLVTGNLGKHLAVWSTAFIFSAIHFQFYGFVPRLLLGAYFGYVVLWTGSLWPAIFAHVMNNVMAGTELWLGKSEPTEMSPWLVAGSVVLTAVLYYVLYRRYQLREKKA